MKIIILLIAMSQVAMSQVVGTVHRKIGSGGSVCSAPGAASDTFAGSVSTPLATHNSCWLNANATYVVSSWVLTGSSAVKLNANFALAGALYNNASDTSQLVLQPASAGQLNNTQVAVRMVLNSHLGYSAGFTGGVSGGNIGTITLNKDNGFFNACFGTWSASTNHTIKVVASGTSTTSINITVDGVACGATFTDSSAAIPSGSPGFFGADGVGSTANNINGPWNDH